MKIRLKLTLALTFLFLVILLLSGSGILSLKWLARDSGNIIKDNYHTLIYVQNIENALGKLQFLLPEKERTKMAINVTLKEIRSNLDLQRKNITEAGEQQLTDELTQNFETLETRVTQFMDKNSPADYYIDQINPVILSLYEGANRIFLINEETVMNKNNLANETAEKMELYMAIFGISSVVIGLLFLIGLPAYISKPVRNLNKAIKEIARGNYEFQLPANTNNEFGQLARSFNRMSAKLFEYEKSNLARILFEKKRLDTVINQLDEAIIGLNEKKKVIFANELALKLLGIDKEKIVGRYAPDVAVNNQLMGSLIHELMLAADDEQVRKFQPVKVIEHNKEKLFAKNIIDITHEPTGEEQTVFIGNVIILTDITEFAEKDRAKTHFIATLSHELKTPVASIEMSTSLLNNEKLGVLNTEQKDLLDIIRENNFRIQRIINEILDLSKIESGTIDIHKTGVSPSLIIEGPWKECVFF